MRGRQGYFHHYMPKHFPSSLCNSLRNNFKVNFDEDPTPPTRPLNIMSRGKVKETTYSTLASETIRLHAQRYIQCGYVIVCAVPYNQNMYIIHFMFELLHLHLSTQSNTFGRMEQSRPTLGGKFRWEV